MNIGDIGGQWYIPTSTLESPQEFYEISDVVTTGYSDVISDISAYATGEKTYRVGPTEDYIFALKVKNEIKRGDIVVFKNEEKGIDVVKRVIGLPGEIISSADGNVLINNEPISDPWARTITDDFIKYEIEENELFVLGDNRKLSTSDSRTLGAIDIDKCLKVKYRYWPYQRIKSYE